MAIRSFSRAYVIAALVMVALMTACIDLIGPGVGPEHARAGLTLGAIVTERIDNSTDVDEFTFRLAHNQEAIAFLQVEEGTPRVNAEIRQVDGPGASTIRQTFESAGSTDDFEATSPGVLRSVGDRDYVIAIRPLLGRTSDPGGTYRLQVRLIDRRPESVPVILTVGDTISEAIDHIADVDEFTLLGAPGDEFTIFVSVEGTARRRVTVLADIPGVFGLQVTAAPGTPLLDNPTPRIVMPTSGSVVVRVKDTGIGVGLHRGPYRLHVRRLNR